MLIGFTGKLGSGKDTAGERLAELTSFEAERLSFAASLKESAAALFDIDPLAWEVYKNDPDVRIQLWEGNSTPEYPGDRGLLITDMSARELLQRYGTESHRDIFGDDFWVEQAMKHYLPISNVYYYFTDCRFTNEADAIVARGGIIIRVLGDNEATGGHASEAGLPDEYINFQIDNSKRDDNFKALDEQLIGIAQIIGFPLAEGVLS